MNSTLLRQPGFTGGELAPVSQGRTESEAYKYGLRTALNFIPTAEGHLLNRPGTRYVCAVKDSTYTPRLIPFVFSDGQTFILEFGDKYIRFVQNGAQVETAPGSGIPYEIGSPWAVADVMRLRYAQSGDVITFTDRNGTTQYPGYELARLSNTNWTLTQTSLSIAGSAYPVGSSPEGVNYRPTIGARGLIAYAAFVGSLYVGGQVYDLGDVVTFVTAGITRLYQSVIENNALSPLTGPAGWNDLSWKTGIAYNADQYAWTAANSGGAASDQQMYMSLVDNNQGPGDTREPHADITHWFLATEDGHPAKIWQWVVTKTFRDATGRVVETLPSKATPPTKVSVYTNRQATIFFGTEDPPPAGQTVLFYNLYRGRNGIFGFVASSPPPKAGLGFLSIKDDGVGPDYGTQPPRGTDPFLLGDGTDSHPAAVAYHEQRIIYGGSGQKPQDFWGSKIGDYHNFDVNTPVQDSDSFNFRPASERLEDIRHFLSLRYLLIFTGSGVWGAYGPSGEITPSGIYLRRYNNNGASFLPPLGVDRTALYLTDRNRVLDLNWDWRSDMYVARDVSIVARHLVEGYVINDWCFAQTPYGMIWSVRNDGTLLSMTYQPGGTEAWARHNTVGIFERVASVPEPIDGSGAFEDAVYVVVKRYTEGLPVRYIERFDSRVLPTMQVAAQPSRTVDGVTKAWDGSEWQPVDSYQDGFHVDNGDGTVSPIAPTAGEIATALAMPNEFMTDVRLCNFLDSSLEYDGRATIAGINFMYLTAVVSHSFHLLSDYVAGAEMTVEIQGGSAFTAADVNVGELILDPDNTTGLGSVRLRVTAFVSSELFTAELQQDMTQEQIDAWVNPGDGRLQRYGRAAGVITGLDHLNGQTVNALVDGAVAGPFVVAGGEITLGSPGVIVQVGLPYNSDMELLDVPADAVKTNVKSVVKATFEVVASRGLYTGESFDKQLDTPQLQTVADTPGVPPLVTGLVGVPIASTWNQGGRACLRQSDPLPLTVIAAIREIMVGGRP